MQHFRLHFPPYSLFPVTSDLLVLILMERPGLEDLGGSCVSQGRLGTATPPSLSTSPASLQSFHLYFPASDSRFRVLPHHGYGRRQLRILLLTHATSAAQLNPALVPPS